MYLCFCVAIFLFGIWVQQKTYGFFNADASTVILSPYGFIDEQGGDYTYRSFQKGEEEGIHTYRFPLNQIDISRLEGDHLGLILYRLNSQGFEVYIDDSFVGAIGDLTGVQQDDDLENAVLRGAYADQHQRCVYQQFYPRLSAFFLKYRQYANKRALQIPIRILFDFFHLHLLAGLPHACLVTFFLPHL